MDAGIPERIRQMNIQDHVGLELSEIMSQAVDEKHRLELLEDWFAEHNKVPWEEAIEAAVYLESGGYRQKFFAALNRIYKDE